MVKDVNILVSVDNMCNFYQHFSFFVFYVTKGTRFATRFLSLGDLIVLKATDFEVVWRTHSGGLDNLGATFFEPQQLMIQRKDTRS